MNRILLEVNPCIFYIVAVAISQNILFLFVDGHFVPGHFVPGHFVPGHFVQRTFRPRIFRPRTFRPQSALFPISRYMCCSLGINLIYYHVST